MCVSVERYLVYVADVLLSPSQPTALSLVTDKAHLTLVCSRKAHPSLLVLSNLTQHFSTMLVGHF